MTQMTNHHCILLILGTGYKSIPFLAYLCKQGWKVWSVKLGSSRPRFLESLKKRQEVILDLLGFWCAASSFPSLSELNTSAAKQMIQNKGSCFGHCCKFKDLTEQKTCCMFCVRACHLGVFLPVRWLMADTVFQSGFHHHDFPA